MRSRSIRYHDRYQNISFFLNNYIGIISEDFFSQKWKENADSIKPEINSLVDISSVKENHLHQSQEEAEIQTLKVLILSKEKELNNLKGKLVVLQTPNEQQKAC